MITYNMLAQTYYLTLFLNNVLLLANELQTEIAINLLKSGYYEVLS